MCAFSKGLYKSCVSNKVEREEKREGKYFCDASCVQTFNGNDATFCSSSSPRLLLRSYNFTNAGTLPISDNHSWKAQHWELKCMSMMILR